MIFMRLLYLLDHVLKFSIIYLIGLIIGVLDFEFCVGQCATQISYFTFSEPFKWFTV